MISTYVVRKGLLPSSLWHSESKKSSRKQEKDNFFQNVTKSVVTFLKFHAIIKEKQRKKTDTMTLGDKIKALRKEHKLTQDELAERLFVTRTAISKWETDKGKPNLESLKQISTIFNIPLDELVSEEKGFDMHTPQEPEKETEAPPTKETLLFGCLPLACFALGIVLEIMDKIISHPLLGILAILFMLGALLLCFVSDIKKDEKNVSFKKAFGKALIYLILALVFIIIINLIQC
jgi:transcriptional regulator with XRE-family HTH domain